MEKAYQSIKRVSGRASARLALACGGDQPHHHADVG